MSAAKYLAFLSAAFKSQVSYRLSTVMGLFTSAVHVFVRVKLWEALVSTGLRLGTSAGATGRGSPAVTLQEMIAFIMITEFVGALTRGDFANELGVSIQDGSVVMHFLRPVSYQLYLFSSFFGKNLYRVFTTALPVVVLGGILAGFPLPPSFPHLLMFLVFTLLGIIIIFELIYITGLLAFWTQKTWFLSWYVDALCTFFGGAVVPLWFYPRALEKLTVFLPFRYISFEGINYYLGKTPLSATGVSLGIAVFWALLLFIIGQLMWIRVQKKVTINGG